MRSGVRIRSSQSSVRCPPFLFTQGVFFRWKPGDPDAPPPPTSPDLRREARAKAGQLKLAPAPPPLPELLLEPLEGDESPPPGVFGSVELVDLLDGYEPSFSSMSITVKTPASSEKPDASRPVVDVDVPMLPSPTAESADHPAPGSAPPSAPPLSATPSNSTTPSAAHLVAAHILSRRSHKTTEDRKKVLMTDPLALAIEPNRVLCKLCERWIQMRKDVTYSPQNWYKHVNICKGKHPYATLPSSRLSYQLY